MQYQQQNLKFQIAQVSKEWRRLILLQGSAQVLLFTISVFLLALLLDSVLALHHGVRLALLAAAAGVFITALVLRVIRPLLNLPSDARIARYLEETYPQLEDRLVTAVEFQDSDQARTSRLILEKLLEDTRFHIAPLNLRKSLKSKAPVLWSSMAFAATVFVAALLLSNFSIFSFQVNRVLTPWEFPTIAPTPGLRVLPGDARVPKNSVQEIRAEISGFFPESVALYYSEDDSTWHKTEMDASVEEGVYLYSFFSLDQDTEYYVKAGEELSDIHAFTVYEAPGVRRVDLKYTYPEYTGLPPKTEVDSGDIWAPEGTRVTITAVADKPLKEAEFVQGDGKQLKASVVNDTLAVATLTVSRDSYYRITITDHDDLSNQPPPEYYIHALPDQPPLLTLERPGRDIKASMVEEVPVQIRVQDDYGVPTVKLHYSINGGEEKQVALDLERTADNPQGIQEFTGEHLFYLEDLDVQPGNFLTYYFRAAKNAAAAQSSAATEIFFIEVRPFEQQFVRSLSQGGMGGSGGGPGGRLSQTQKEIVIATWKLIGKKDKLSPTELTEDAQVILDSQKNLQEVTESALMQMQQRSLFSGQEGDDVSTYYTEAADAMQRAIEQLRDDNLESALPHEKEALTALLTAEAQLKEIQVQQGQGAGNMADLQQLSELFEQEMDKLSNKYETLQNNQQQRTNQELNETLEKVKELARRQQQFNRRMRDLANQSEEEKRRQIEELRRQQDEIRRQAQELARQAQQMQQGNSELPRDMQERLRKATSEMTNASNNLRNQNTELAAAKGTRALDRLQQLEDSLRRNQKESLRRELSELEQQFQRMADAQRKLSEEVETLSPQQQELEKSLQGARENQSQIREEMKDATERLEALVSQSRQNQNEMSREMNEAKREIERSEIEKKMQRAEQLLQEKQLHSAHEAQRDLAASMEKLEQKMTQLRGLMAETEEEKLDLALNQTRRLRDQLESMQREAESLQRGQAGEQSGQGEQASQAGPGESGRPMQDLDPEKLDRWNEQLARSRNDLEMLQQNIRIDSSLAGKARRINKNLEGVVRTFNGGTAERWQLIEQQVLEPLKHLEAELAQKLELLNNKEKLFLARDEQIPSEYKELVEKYYEVLSRTQE